MASVAASSNIYNNAVSDHISIAVPSGLSSQNLLLDSDIRDWVVLPLLVIMIAAGLLRQTMSQYLKANTKTICPIESRAKSCLRRVSRFRGGGCAFISGAKLESRKRYFSSKSDNDEETSLLRVEATIAEEAAESKKGNELDMLNSMNMLDGMKGNMAFMVQNMVMMQGISHFFKGYVLVKVPFTLTNGFKQMFQRGLDLSTLETSYVSSVSWYFLVMFGLRAFFRLVIGDVPQEAQEAAQLQQSFGVLVNAPGGPMQKFDAAKALRTEADGLEMFISPKSQLDDVEKRILGKQYPKKSKKAGPGDYIFAGTGGAKNRNKVFSILLLVKRILLPTVISFPYPTASDKNVSVVLGGSYNPPHNGHLGMLKYLSQRYGKVYAVIGVNPNKKYEVTAEERANLLREMIEASTTITEKNIQVEVVTTYIWRFAYANKCSLLFRGIRTWEKDGREERNLQVLNTWGPILYGPLKFPLPTIFLEGDPKYTHVSSTIIRNLCNQLNKHNKASDSDNNENNQDDEVSKIQKELSELVPGQVTELVTKLYSKKNQ